MVLIWQHQVKHRDDLMQKNSEIISEESLESLLTKWDCNCTLSQLKTIMNKCWLIEDDLKSEKRLKVL